MQCVITFKDRSLDLIAPHAHGIAALMLASAHPSPSARFRRCKLTRLQVVCRLGKLPLPAHPFSRIIQDAGAGN